MWCILDWMNKWIGLQPREEKNSPKAPKVTQQTRMKQLLKDDFHTMDLDLDGW